MPADSDEEDASSSSSSSTCDDGSALDSSVLGTKDYWDSAYAKELVNFSEIGDEGTVWFGEDAVRRVVKWLNGQSIDKNSLVLDLGSGNGSTLLSLATSGWRRLTGVDYSRGAVELSASIARRKVEDGWLKGFKIIELTGGSEDVNGEEATSAVASLSHQLHSATPAKDSAQCPFLSFAVCDITIPLTETSSSSLPSFDVILDKGTFDAISLCPDQAEEKKRLYVEFVKAALKSGGEMESGGIFSLTSCNWTEEELMKVFGDEFALKDRIQFPSFQFGGKTGSTVTSLVFTKRKV